MSAPLSCNSSSCSAVTVSGSGIEIAFALTRVADRDEADRVMAISDKGGPHDRANTADHLAPQFRGMHHATLHACRVSPQRLCLDEIDPMFGVVRGGFLGVEFKRRHRI